MKGYAYGWLVNLKSRGAAISRAHPWIPQNGDAEPSQLKSRVVYLVHRPLNHWLCTDPANTWTFDVPEHDDKGGHWGEPERAPSNELLAKFTGGHLGPSSSYVQFLVCFDLLWSACAQLFALCIALLPAARILCLHVTLLDLQARACTLAIFACLVPRTWAACMDRTRC